MDFSRIVSITSFSSIPVNSFFHIIIGILEVNEGIKGNRQRSIYRVGKTPKFGGQ
jgi:hypothetical protein